MKEKILLELANKWQRDATRSTEQDEALEANIPNAIAEGIREGKRECAERLRVLIQLLGIKMDEIDKAQQERDQQLSITLTKKKQEQKLKEARLPIDDCIECGNSIPIARRIAVPGCQRCITCKERFELLQKRTKHA